MTMADQIAATPRPEEADMMNYKDGCGRFVERVLDAVDKGDNETPRKLVEPLHPPDVADLIELAARDEREGLVKALPTSMPTLCRAERLRPRSPDR